MTGPSPKERYFEKMRELLRARSERDVSEAEEAARATELDDDWWRLTDTEQQEAEDEFGTRVVEGLSTEDKPASPRWLSAAVGALGGAVVGGWVAGSLGALMGAALGALIGTGAKR